MNNSSLSVFFNYCDRITQADCLLPWPEWLLFNSCSIGSHLIVTLNLLISITYPQLNPPVLCWYSASGHPVPTQPKCMPKPDLSQSNTWSLTIQQTFDEAMKSSPIPYYYHDSPKNNFFFLKKTLINTVQVSNWESKRTNTRVYAIYDAHTHTHDSIISVSTVKMLTTPCTLPPTNHTPSGEKNLRSPSGQMWCQILPGTVLGGS